MFVDLVAVCSCAVTGGGGSVGEDVFGGGVSSVDECCADCRVAQREDLCCEECGVDGAGFTDGERADGDAGGHLDDGEERVGAFEGFGFDGYAQDWERGFGCAHAREVCRPARAGDDDLQAAVYGGLGVSEEEVGCSVSADDGCFAGDAE